MKTSISMMFAVLFISTALKVSAQEVAQTNIQPLNNSVSLISQLQPVSFNYDTKRADKLKISNKTQLGFVAADVQKVLPVLVTKTAKDYPAGKNASATAIISSVDYKSLIPLLVGSIKEQQQQIEQLRRELDSLKSRNTK